MSERLLPSELLQHRSDLIVTGIRAMIQEGLNPWDIRYFEQQDPEQHRDMVQVYLGIKPAASHLAQSMIHTRE